MSNELNPVLLKTLLLKSYYHFVRYFFKIRYGRKIQKAKHVKVMCDFIQKIVFGKFNTPHAIINIPTGYSKTLLCGEMLFPWLMAINPASKNINISFSDSIPHKTSEASKLIISLPEYQRLFNVKINKNEKSKGFWRTSQGGGLFASGNGGSITGHDAGSVPSNPKAPHFFDGIFIWDDPMKPSDCVYQNYRDKILEYYEETHRTRLRNPKTPFVIVMQRLHDDDISGRLLRGATSDRFNHLILPAKIESNYIYPEDYKHGIYYNHDLPIGMLWEEKLSLDKLQEEFKFSPYVTWAEKMQKPMIASGGLFKDEYWADFDIDDNIVFDYRFIVGDTAQKTKEHNDFSVFQCWGLKTHIEDNKAVKCIHLLDQIRGKWEAPELEDKFILFYMKHRGTGTQTTSPLRYARIEDKASGTGLIQSVSRVDGINIRAIQRNTDKYTRALDFIPEIARGFVKLPLDLPFSFDIKREAREFTANNTHKHDDMIDCVLDAVQELSEQKNSNSGVW